MKANRLAELVAEYLISEFFQKRIEKYEEWDRIFAEKAEQDDTKVHITFKRLGSDGGTLRVS